MVLARHTLFARCTHKLIDYSEPIRRFSLTTLALRLVSCSLNMNMDNHDATTHCCAECGKEGGASLKACKSCMVAKYCNAECQKNHWPKHKKECKKCAAELRDEALFKDPPPKEDCPICFLPMPKKLVCCISLPPATITSIPIFDYARANEELAGKATEVYYPCCGKGICGGCVDSFCKSGNDAKCPYCNSDGSGKTDEEAVGEIMKRVEANDAGAISALADCYCHGQLGLLQDRTKAIELWKQAAKLGSSEAHFALGIWVSIIVKGVALRRPRYTTRPQLWQEMKWQETTLEQWR
jgi:hypothetical protein